MKQIHRCLEQYHGDDASFAVRTRKGRRIERSGSDFLTREIAGDAAAHERREKTGRERGSEWRGS